MGIRHIYVGTLTIVIQPEALWMGPERNIRNYSASLRIDYCQRTIAVTHKNPVVGGINPHIVGVIAELDAPDGPKIRALQEPDGPVTAIGNIHSVTRWIVINALRLR